MRASAPLVLFVILALILWQGLSHNKNSSSASINKQSPIFSLPSLLNPDQIVSEDIFSGQVTVLNVWASWCYACQIEHAFWMSLIEGKQFFNRSNDSSNLQLIGIDFRDHKEDAKAWLKVEGNPFNTIISDERGRLGLDLGIRGTPETFIVDSGGVIRFRHVGVISEQLWYDTMVPLIKRLQGNQQSNQEANQAAEAR